MEQRLQTEETQDASQARVTPEEFARALSALEEERQAEVRAQDDGRAPVGRLIDELQVDFTAQEVMAEVERQRAEARQDSERPLTQTRSEARTLSEGGFRLLVVGAVLLMILFVGIFFARQVVTVAPPQSLVAPRAVPGPAMSYSLQSLPEGVPGTVSWPSLAQLLYGGNLRTSATLGYEQRYSGAFVQGQSMMVKIGTWRVVNHDHKSYVRGWAEASEVMAGGPFTLYASVPPEPMASRVRQITVPLEGAKLKSSGELSGVPGGKLTLTGVKIDEHLRERW